MVQEAWELLAIALGQETQAVALDVVLVADWAEREVHQEAALVRQKYDQEDVQVMGLVVEDELIPAIASMDSVNVAVVASAVGPAVRGGLGAAVQDVEPVQKVVFEH